VFTMPSSATEFRSKCGAFNCTFINFMLKRAEFARKFSARVPKLPWPLTFVQSVFLSTVLIAMNCQCVTGSGQYCGGVVGVGVSCYRDSIISLTLHPMHETAHSWFLLLATQWHLCHRPKQTVLFVLQVTWFQLGLLCFVIMAVMQFLAPILVFSWSTVVTHNTSVEFLTYRNATRIDLLILCGDIELNPGPGDNHTDDLIKEMGASLSAQMTRMSDEVRTMSGNLHTLSSRLDALNDDLHSKQEQINDVKSRTDSLEDEVTQLKKQLEYQDITSRRDNIIFYGVAEADGKEFEDDCVRYIVKTLNKHDSMKTWTANDFSCAHRLGKRGVDQTRPRPLLAKLIRSREKHNLISSKVMRSRLGKDGIRMNDDLTTKQRTTLNSLRQDGQVAYYRGTRLMRRARQRDGETTRTDNRHNEHQQHGDNTHNGHQQHGDNTHNGHQQHGDNDADRLSARGYASDDDWAPLPRHGGGFGGSSNSLDDTDAVAGAHINGRGDLRLGDNGSSKRPTPSASGGRGGGRSRSSGNGEGNAAVHGSNSNIIRGFGRGTPRRNDTDYNTASVPSPNEGATDKQPATHPRRTRLQTRAINTFFSSSQARDDVDTSEVN